MHSRTVWRLQRSCKCISEWFDACSVSANEFPNGLALAAFLQMNSRTVWCLQRSCKRIPEWFGACSVSANAFPNGLTLAAFLQTHSRTVWCLQRFCEQKTFWFRARSLLARVWNGRGGACVPARTSAQRRFHAKIYLRITYHARGFNDGCALAGRHGRAHRRRPYQTSSCFFTSFH